MKSKVTPADRVKIILVEPQAPGNVGSTARVMKNFGLSCLRLVRPCTYKVPETYWRGVHADDVIDGAEVYDSLPEALKDVALAAATTTRKRFTHFPLYTPREYAGRVREISADTNLGIVFGRENNGLTNEEVHQCHLMITVPTSPEFPALNLSHAVGVVAYELFQGTLDHNPNFEWRYADAGQIEALYTRMGRVLAAVGFRPRKTMEEFLLGVRRILGRTPLEDRDVKILHKIFKEIEKFVFRPKRSPKRRSSHETVYRSQN